MENYRVLIVDDEKFFVQPIKMFLEKKGFQIIVADDGISGLQKARHDTPDVILLDLMLPGIDGFLVCRLLKFDEKYKDIPVIIVSAKNGQKDKELGEKCGAEMYLTKPIDPQSLVNSIGEVLS